MAKVCERCSTMYTEYMAVCPKDGTQLTVTPVDEDTLVLQRDSQNRPANTTNVRSRCETCSSDWTTWLDICPNDNIPTTISIGSRFQILKTLIRTDRVDLFTAKDVFTERKVLIVILEHQTTALNAQLSEFFAKAAKVHNAELATIGLLDDGRPFAICNPVNA